MKSSQPDTNGAKVRARVLLVDDDPEDFLITRELLDEAQASDFEVEHVADPDRALEAICHGDHDVVLLDYLLGAVDGLSLLKESRERGCELPMIVLTGAGEIEASERALHLGADDFLSKARLDPASLERSIRYSIERRRILKEKNRALEALQASEARFRKFADAVPQIAWSATPEGLVDYSNERWEEYSGGDAATWMDRLHPDDAQEVQTAWQEALTSGHIFEIECRIQSGEGEFRWFLARAVPVHEQEQIARWFGTCTDIEEQKEAEAELERRVRERTAELEAANREMEGFTYSVSHDLRTPLRAIVSTSSVLIEDFGGALPDEAKQLLRRQAYNANRLGVLIDDLLRLSRITRQEMERSRVDVSSIARDVAKDLADRAHPRTGFDIEPEVYVYGDPNLVRLAVHNLLENAVKFSPMGGKIVLGSQRERDETVVFVRDEGIGFDPQYAHKLFKPFERLHLDEDYPGTGIGLANVMRIAQRHGGRAWAQATLGEGATFFVSFGS